MGGRRAIYFVIVREGNQFSSVCLFCCEPQCNVKCTKPVARS